MEIGNLMLLGGNFFRAGGAEKLELFQTVCLIPRPKSPFLAPFWRSKHLFPAPTAFSFTSPSNPYGAKKSPKTAYGAKVPPPPEGGDSTRNHKILAP